MISQAHAKYSMNKHFTNQGPLGAGSLHPQINRNMFIALSQLSPSSTLVDSFADLTDADMSSMDLKIK